MTAPFPLHRGEREGLRTSWADHTIERAKHEAKLIGLSNMCRASNHGPEGCRNDGTGCLCACHDPKAAP